MRVPIVLPTLLDVRVEKVLVDDHWLAIVCVGGMVHFWGKEERRERQHCQRAAWASFALYVPAEYSTWDFAQFCYLKLHEVYSAVSGRVFITMLGNRIRLISPEDARCVDQQLLPFSPKLREAIGIVGERFLCVGDNHKVQWFDLWANFSKPLEPVIVSSMPSECGNVTKIAHAGPHLCVLTSQKRLVVFHESRCIFMHDVEQVDNLLLTPSIVAVCQSSQTLELLSSEKHRQSIHAQEHPWVNVRSVVKVSPVSNSNSCPRLMRRRTIAAVKLKEPEDDHDVIAACSSVDTVIFTVTKSSYSPLQRLRQTIWPIIDIGWLSWVEVIRSSVYIFPDRWSTGPLNEALSCGRRQVDYSVICRGPKGLRYCTLAKEIVEIHMLRGGPPQFFFLPGCNLLAAPGGTLMGGSRKGEVWHWDSVYRLSGKISLPSELPIVAFEPVSAKERIVCAIQRAAICVVLKLPLILFQILLDPAWLQCPLQFSYIDERLYVVGDENRICHVWNDDRILLSKNAEFPAQKIEYSYWALNRQRTARLPVVCLPLEAEPLRQSGSSLSDIACSEENQTASTALGLPRIGMPFFIAAHGADESIGVGIREPWSSYALTQWALLHVQSINPHHVNLALALRVLADGEEPSRSHAKAIILKYFATLPFVNSFRRSLRPWALRMQMVNDKASLFALAYSFDANASLIKNPRDFKALGMKLSTELQAVIFDDDNEYWQRLAADAFVRAFPNLLPAITSDENNSLGDLLLKCFAKYQQYGEAREAGAFIMDIMVLVGAVDPLTFVQVMAKASKRLDLGVRGSYACSSLFVLGTFVRRKPDRCAPIVTMIVETVLRCLEPSDPHARKTLLIPATQALHQIVQVLPMATFHQDTQRFAVGTSAGPVHVYDLRTATKWRILEGHQCKVLAIAFSADGQKLASYAVDGAAMVWQISSSGILGFLGVAGKMIKCHSLEPILENRVRIPRLKWTSTTLQLVRENGVTVNLPT